MNSQYLPYQLIFNHYTAFSELFYYLFCPFFCRHILQIRQRQKETEMHKACKAETKTVILSNFAISSCPT